MKIFQNREVPFLQNISAQIALVLAISLILWATGAPLFLNHAKAANLSNQSDTLSESNPNSLSKHTIVYTNATSTATGQTIVIGLDPVTSAFTEAFSVATSSDIFLLDNGSALTFQATCGAPGFSATGNYNGGSNENLTLTLCPSTSIAAGHTITVVVGSTTKLWTNPAAGSYRITIGGTQDNSGETRVAIVPNVILTAAINTSFTFTVAGTATGTTLLGGNATSTNTDTNTTLPFGTLASSTAASSTILIQQLTVTTNARNGFSVTVQENQPPTSGTGAIINLFSNGATTSLPITWVSPTATLDQYNTYSHFGISSDDTDLNTNEFGSGTKWAGNIDQPRVVFSHSGPADGVTQNKGAAKVAYRIQITDLQPAGNDYTNTIRYVATPTF